MKLIAKCQIAGVKVLKKVNSRRKQFSIKPDTALPGDIYEGVQKHIDRGYAQAMPQQPVLEEQETGAGDEDKAARIAELKQRAKELGASGNQLKIRSEDKLLELIEKLSEGGSDDELGIE